jgi:N-acetylneuraminic acid mutarotase
VRDYIYAARPLRHGGNFVDARTKKKPMAGPVHHQAMVESGGKIYVFGGFVAPTTGGGWEPVDNAWEYDPVVDSWKG